MGHFAGVCDKLGVNSAGRAFVFGVVCAFVGALAASLAWRAFSKPNLASREIIGVGVNSDAGLVGDVVPEMDAMSVNHVPLHKRSDYRVNPPDILTIQFTGVSADAQDEEMRAISGERLVQPNGAIDLGNEFGSLPVEGLTTSEIKTAIEERVNAKRRNWCVDVSVYAQNSKV